MTKLAKLKYDAHSCGHTCKHKLGNAKVDISEETVDLEKLTEVAQMVSDEWSVRHKRLAKVIAEELLTNEYIADASKIGAAQCVPFYLRVYADPDCVISYTVAFNVPSVLDDNDEYVDVEKEVNGEWVNSEICSTE